MNTDITKEPYWIYIDNGTTAYLSAEPPVEDGYRPSRQVTIKVVEPSIIFETDTWTSTFWTTWSDRYLKQIMPTLARMVRETEKVTGDDE